MKKFFIAAGIILAALAAVATLITLEALVLWALIGPATGGAISFSPWQAIWIMVLVNLLALKFRGRRGEKGKKGKKGNPGYQGPMGMMGLPGDPCPCSSGAGRPRQVRKVGLSNGGQQA